MLMSNITMRRGTYREKKKTATGTRTEKGTDLMRKGKATGLEIERKYNQSSLED